MGRAPPSSLRSHPPIPNLRRHSRANPATVGPMSLSRRLTLGALLAAMAVAFADSSIVVLALPQLLRQFGTSITATAWVVTAYNLVLALASLALIPVMRRTNPIRLIQVGLALFLAASVACGAASDLWPLVTFRSIQGLGGALLLAGSLPLVRNLARSAQQGNSLWIGAGIIGASLGPAAGGALTEVFSWQAIFFAQSPIAAVALVASFLLRPERHLGQVHVAVLSPSYRRWSANLALAFASAALVGLLFLSVILLVDIWRFGPLAAAGVVSAIPLAAPGAQLLTRASMSASIAGGGFVLLAAGLAGMALLPARELAWVVASLFLSGLGLGLAISSLSQSALSGSRDSSGCGRRHDLGSARWPRPRPPDPHSSARRRHQQRRQQGQAPSDVDGARCASLYFNQAPRGSRPRARAQPPGHKRAAQLLEDP